MANDRQRGKMLEREGKLELDEAFLEDITFERRRKGGK